MMRTNYTGGTACYQAYAIRIINNLVTSQKRESENEGHAEPMSHDSVQNSGSENFIVQGDMQFNVVCEQ